MRGVIIATPGACFLILWQILVQGSDRLRFLFGTPIQVFKVMLVELHNGGILRDFGITGLEAALGLLVGTILGTVLGILMWADRRVTWVVRPYVIVIGAVPVFALAPMLIIWFGTGLLSKVVMASVGTGLISLIQAFEGATDASNTFRLLAATLSASRWQIASKIAFPGGMRWVLAGARINVGFAVIGAFIAEFVVADAGIGHFILRSSGLYDVPRLILGLVLLGAIALVLSGAVRLAEVLWVPWLNTNSADRTGT